MIAMEKSLPEETKKFCGVALGKNLVKSHKNVVAITFFFQIKLINKLVLFKNRCQFLFVLSEPRDLFSV